MDEAVVAGSIGFSSGGGISSGGSSFLGSSMAGAVPCGGLFGGKIHGKTKGTWWKTNGTSRWHGKFDGKDWEKP